MQDTREKILEAAERLFAEKGFAATSLRAITQAAGVNLAAVNYHFGGKETLFKAVVERRLRPMNEERLRRLEACQSKGGMSLEAVIRAFIEPGLTLASQDPQKRDTFMRLVGRLYAEPLEEIFDYFARQFEVVLLRFKDALAKILKDLPAEEILWRLHFITGVMLHPFLVGSRISKYTEGICKFDNPKEVIERMIIFAKEGVKAKPAGTAHT